ncbi:glycosyltransferase family 2 protein [Frankia sp. ACN1ag]|uniref:glycosyltransferase n=1 Tax=Frankia sp. ACN1ag TaxID=102891 RepID=UPI0006DD0237|nr:glycosyltransferase family 2 protein [Frankia sp. ACN1ag]KQC38788.1 glycosyl transferase [Frankia sp. ACN1ag]
MTPTSTGDLPDDLTGLLRGPVLPQPRTPPDGLAGAAAAGGARADLPLPLPADAIPDLDLDPPTTAHRLVPVAPRLSVVVPTRNEAHNIEPLLRRLDEALRGLAGEVIFVDDSDDGTPEAIARVRPTVSLPVRVHHRAPRDRVGGLGGAVSEGFALCAAPYAVIIDGDLQHPPETIPALLAAALHDAADVVIGSRYAPGGSASGLAGTTRHLVSTGSNLLCRLAFPRRLRGVSDVMSGFFLVRVAAVDRAGLRPDGYKILLELLATAGPLRIREVGYAFAERHAGASNASMSEGVRFVRRLFSLRVPRPARFALVGASGTVPNLFGTAVLHHLGLHYLAAAILATQVAIAWNFAGCELLVWDRLAGSRLRRYPAFAIINNLDLVVRLPLLALLVGRWGFGVGTATLLSLAAAVIIRYLVVERLVYRRRPAGSPTPTPSGTAGPSRAFRSGRARGGSRPGGLSWPAGVPGEEATDAAT